MEKYYFTYGTDSKYPFCGGWTIIFAPTLKSAIQVFKAYHPNRAESDCINCSDYYSAKQFESTEMYKNGNFGAKCHEIIGRLSDTIEEDAEYDLRRKH